jgi:hypothetical protein
MFKESKIEIINLSEGRKLTDEVLCSGLGLVVIPEQRYRAMGTEIKLLRKCLDEASENRDKYRELYVDAKRQLDELNSKNEQEKTKLVGSESFYRATRVCGNCRYCNPYPRVCMCKGSNSHGEKVKMDHTCEYHSAFANEH